MQSGVKTFSAGGGAASLCCLLLLLVIYSHLLREGKAAVWTFNDTLKRVASSKSCVVDDVCCRLVDVCCRLVDVCCCLVDVCCCLVEMHGNVLPLARVFT